MVWTESSFPAVLLELTLTDSSVSEPMVQAVASALPWGPESVREELHRSIELGVLQVLWRLKRRVQGRDCQDSEAQPTLLAQQPDRGRRLASQLESLLGFVPESTTLRPRSARQLLRARRLSALLDSVHGLLSSGRHATCRELYYRHLCSQ